MENQQKEALEYKGQQYLIEDLSKEGQHAYFQLRDIKQQMSDLQFKHSQLDMAGRGYNTSLETALAEYVESQTPEAEAKCDAVCEATVEPCDTTEAPCEAEASVTEEAAPEVAPTAAEVDPLPAV